MGLVLNKADDPRGIMDKARRKDFERFAEAHNVTEISDGTSVIEAKHILMNKGLAEQFHGWARENVRVQSLGQRGPGAPPQPEPGQEVIEMSADAAFLAQQKAVKPVSDMNIQELRKECKSRGIKQSRTDNIESLRARLNGENAA